jgi:transcriptional regulator with XRE-family HTH domain
MFSHKTTEKPYPAGLGNKIKMVRESSNLSQEYVASKLNLSQQAYSRMEKNPDNITVGRLRELSAILGVPFNTLAGEEDMYIQQNYNQQGGNAGTVMYIQGLADSERAVYEKRIEDLKEQISSLNALLLKLSK